MPLNLRKVHKTLDRAMNPLCSLRTSFPNANESSASSPSMKNADATCHDANPNTLPNQASKPAERGSPMIGN